MFWRSIFFFALQFLTISTLFAAMMNGVFDALSMLMLSFVCGCIPSLMSMTSIAMSAMFPPLFRSDVKAACPGVSMKSSPGIVISFLSVVRSVPHIFFSASVGIMLAPIAWVIPPASLVATALPLILSKSDVFP